ncbi:MAG: DNA translocase FtsK, partial [Deinococcus-Thermus bacterium]|nr:DNA translocase FtsK [Deinococcota bacterium]
MAYPTNQRDPLLDSAMQAAIEKRGRELAGLVLLGAGLAGVALLASYVPEDASFFSSTDAPAENLLGRTGASVAGPLFLVVGFGAWVVAGTLLVWGVRLMANRGAERALGRLIFAPVAVAAASVYASTIVPSSGWTHSFGLGGLFGDTVLGALLNILPVHAAEGVRLLSVPIGLAMVAVTLFVAGFTKV